MYTGSILFPSITQTERLFYISKQKHNRKSERNLNPGHMLDCEGLSAARFKGKEFSINPNSKTIPMKQRSITYITCIRSVMTYSAALWVFTQKKQSLLQSRWGSMLYIMCGLTNMHKVPRPKHWEDVASEYFYCLCKWKEKSGLVMLIDNKLTLSY